IPAPPGPAPSPPGGGNQGQHPAPIGRSRDPNDKLHPAGSGESYYIQTNDTLAYTIRFENQPDATAPAQKVVITDTPNPNLDLDTFELTERAFADQRIAIPAGLDRYEATLPTRSGGVELLVEARAALDRASRAFVLSLRAIDRATGWTPDDALLGFLYP